MSALTNSEFTKFPRFVCKRKRTPSSNDTDLSRKELCTVAKRAQLSKALALPKSLSLNPCEVFDALVDTTLQVKDKEYVWRIFCHIKTTGNKLKWYNYELKRCRSERDQTRKELEECKKKLELQVKDTNLAAQCKKFAENRAGEIEQLRRRMHKLKEELESEKCTSELLSSEVARKKAKTKHGEETVVPNERHKFIEHQVKQLSSMLAQRNRERSFENSQIENEYNKMKGNYDQALITISQLKVRLAQKLKSHLETT